MNIVSALDLLPVAVVILCAVDLLRQSRFFKTPISSGLCMLIALGAFKKFALILHGLDVAWWWLLIDAAAAALFGFFTYSRHFKGVSPRRAPQHKSTFIQR